MHDPTPRRRRFQLIVTGFVAALLLTGGCAGLELGDFGFGEPYGATSGDTRVSEASLQGDLGPARGLDHSATDVDVETWGDETTVGLTVARSDSAAMTVLTLHDATDYVDVREGETVTVYDSRRPSTYGAARLLGCAGPSVGAWSYDTYSDNLVVHVERRRYARNVLTYHYMGDFTYYDAAQGGTRITTVSGSFDLRID